MLLTMDRFGRIVLPKALRKRLGLEANNELELVEQSDGILLRPVDQQPSMIKVEGLWVHQGTAGPDIKWDRVVDDIREERLQSLHRSDYNPLDRDYIKNDPYNPFHSIRR